MNAKEVLEFAAENDVVMVDLRFTDWPGTWQHCSFPINEIAEEHFEEGLGFDGSSIRGWQSIHESDMLMVPDSKTAFVDPFYKHPTLVMISDIIDPITKDPYSRDPRHIQGLWGPYRDVTLEGYWLTEGGQSATGALLDHAIRLGGPGCEPDARTHAQIIDRIAELRRQGQADLGDGLLRLLQVVGDPALGHLDAELVHRVLECLAILAALDGVDLDADDLDAVLFQDASPGELGAEIQPCLTT